MRAILIDPFACTVTEIDFNHESYRSIYPAISHESMPVDCFDVVRLDDGDGIFIDDEGLNKPCDRFFTLDCSPQPYAGRGLILGSDAEGDAVDAKVSLRWVESQVTFHARFRNALFPTLLPWKREG